MPALYYFTVRITPDSTTKSKGVYESIRLLYHFPLIEVDLVRNSPWMPVKDILCRDKVIHWQPVQFLCLSVLLSPKVSWTSLWRHQNSSPLYISKWELDVWSFEFSCQFKAVIDSFSLLNVILTFRLSVPSRISTPNRLQEYSGGVVAPHVTDMCAERGHRREAQDLVLPKEVVYTNKGARVEIREGT
ncbi:hypothetical protein BYT27DRAFT_7243656 [Phlegmacium glaucopus]|nr:hypothetical protein BYT27DRAFT_7243656 [Phlegmacium glaucopus]